MGTRQMLSQIMPNIGVLGQGGRLAGLHWGLAAGRTESLMVAAAELVEMMQEDEMVLLL